MIETAVFWTSTDLDTKTCVNQKNNKNAISMGVSILGWQRCTNVSTSNFVKVFEINLLNSFLVDTVYNVEIKVVRWWPCVGYNPKWVVFYSES